jgi:hypothetical protein
MAQTMTEQTPPAPQTNDLMAKLEQLKKMYESDLINEQEYASKKQQILELM